jgi:regulator of protease activity HflC (stomatin/prohibitin superfamily)
MKKILLFSLTVMFILTGCTMASPEADEEGVLTMKPWLFGHGGVSDNPVSSGLTWCAFTTDVDYIKITPIAYDEHIEDAYSNDNTQLDFDIQIILQVESGKSPILIKNYGKDWYKNNIHKEFVSHFYNLVGNYSPFDLMSNRSVTDSTQVLMADHMRGYIGKLSEHKEFPVKVNNVIIGKAKPNDDMKKEMDKTAAIIQAKKTQEQRILSEKARAEAEVQRAKADKAYMQEMNLSTSDYINLKWIETIANKEGANIDVLVGGNANQMWNVRR